MRVCASWQYALHSQARLGQLSPPAYRTKWARASYAQVSARTHRLSREGLSGATGLLVRGTRQKQLLKLQKQLLLQHCTSPRQVLLRGALHARPSSSVTHTECLPAPFLISCVPTQILVRTSLLIIPRKKKVLGAPHHVHFPVHVGVFQRPPGAHHPHVDAAGARLGHAGADAAVRGELRAQGRAHGRHVRFQLGRRWCVRARASLPAAASSSLPSSLSSSWSSSSSSSLWWPRIRACAGGVARPAAVYCVSGAEWRRRRDD